jgi:hypothetical protein
VQRKEAKAADHLFSDSHIKKKLNHRSIPEIYRHGLFGYFLLMDKQWQQIRLSIGFDLDNV